MRKLIGTIVILLLLYAGFFGIDKFNIDPFILNWFKSDDSKETIEKITDTTKDVVEEVIDVTSEVIDSIKDTTNKD